MPDELELETVSVNAYALPALAARCVLRRQMVYEEAVDPRLHKKTVLAKMMRIIHRTPDRWTSGTSSGSLQWAQYSRLAVALQHCIFWYYFFLISANSMDACSTLG